MWPHHLPIFSASQEGLVSEWALNGLFLKKSVRSRAASTHSCTPTQREMGKECWRLRVSVPFHFWNGPAIDKFLFFFFIIVFIGIIPNDNFFQERFVWYLKVELALHSGEKSRSSLCYKAACFSLGRCWRQKCTVACLSIFHLQEHLFIDLCLYILKVCGINLFFEI